MAIYEYECNNCGERFEIFGNPYNAAGKVDCPKCGAGDTSRIYSAFHTGASAQSCEPSRFT